MPKRTAYEFRTLGRDVDISGVGWLGPNGSRGVDISFAATRMHELQDEDGKPLSGEELLNTAREWAEARGLVVVDLDQTNAENAGLQQEDKPAEAKADKAEVEPEPEVEPVVDSAEQEDN